MIVFTSLHPDDRFDIPDGGRDHVAVIVGRDLDDRLAFSNGSLGNDASDRVDDPFDRVDDPFDLFDLFDLFDVLDDSLDDKLDSWLDGLFDKAVKLDGVDSLSDIVHDFSDMVDNRSDLIGLTACAMCASIEPTHLTQSLSILDIA